MGRVSKPRSLLRAIESGREGAPCVSPDSVWPCCWRPPGPRRPVAGAAAVDVLRPQAPESRWQARQPGPGQGDGQPGGERRQQVRVHAPGRGAREAAAADEQGFRCVGFPSNDFGGQEPGTAQEIATFCRLTYDVTFPMFEKVVTRKGADQSAVDPLRLHRQPAGLELQQVRRGQERQGGASFPARSRRKTPPCAPQSPRRWPPASASTAPGGLPGFRQEYCPVRPLAERRLEF